MVNSNSLSVRLACWLLAMTGCLVVIAGVASQSGNQERNADQKQPADPQAAAIVAGNESHGDHRGNNGSSACTPRSVETFPPDLFTLEQKQRGAIVIHVLVSAWLLVALATICKDYFVASLEAVCESLHLKPDVAGATFMAAGNSALELLAAVIGVFIADSDVGISTIVGSAIFNNLMIVSLCGLAASQAVQLSWWPMIRDCGFYCLSVSALIAIIHDGLVTWYESVIQLVLFAIYVLVMVFNSRIDSAISTRYPKLATGGLQRLKEEGEAAEAVDEADADLGIGEVLDDRKSIIVNGGGSSTNCGRESHAMEIWSVESGGADATAVTVVIDSGPEWPFTPPVGLLNRAYWLVTLPWLAAFYVTIPDCRRPGVWRRLFILTFLVSVVWISVMIYLLVWMVCATGDALGVPDTVMGLTLLAIGTCMPDAMAGTIVSMRGMGDMAIANSVASNVFDITACLGLPWFISTALRNPGSTVVINSSGLTYTSITLLSTVVFLLVAVHLNKMRIDRKLGFIFLAVYLGVVTFACLYETNIFGQLNPPPCPRIRL